MDAGSNALGTVMEAAEREEQTTARGVRIFFAENFVLPLKFESQWRVLLIFLRVKPVERSSRCGLAPQKRIF